MSEPALHTIIGMISGTSMDGIDIALLQTDGLDRVEFGPADTRPYPAELRQELIDFLHDPARAMTDPLTGLEAKVTEAFSKALLAFLSDHSLTPAAIDLVGLHGQTVYHNPALRFTRQLGNGEQMRHETGIAVVDQFRLNDVAQGGQGAPLVPLYHAALARALPKPLVILNWGGVGNVTYLDDNRVLAFDTGPASALCDDWTRRHFNLPYDEDGRLARQGQVHAPSLAHLLDHPFFAVPPPKSLDRNAFHAGLDRLENLSPLDGLATLTAFTIQATAKAMEHMPQKPLRWLVGGGGRHNQAFMEGLRAALHLPVDPVEQVGWRGDSLEAECFAYLAQRARLGLPLSLPDTTGVPQPCSGGRVWPLSIP
jgi:anhydro-N-acetylmuramic acid kinase